MLLNGKLLKGNVVLKDETVTKSDENISFHDIMEELFLQLCKNMDIPVPIWLKKNTNEVSKYRKTFFGKEQFVEEVIFDRFILEIEV